MALKGFLASGFQKLIGASRLKGANDRFLGEYNVQNKTTTTFPIAETLNDGFNLIRYTGSSSATYTSGALFSANPTTNTVVTILNASAGNLFNLLEVNTTGGTILRSAAGLVPNTAITLVYDTTTARWTEINRSPMYRGGRTFVIAGVVTDLNLLDNNIEQIVDIDSTYTGLISLTTMTPVTNTPTGTRVTIVARTSLSETTRIIFVAATSYAGTNTFIMNGDFELAKGSSISFYYNGLNWQELSRQTPVI